jgi:hypothetical protein
LRHDLFNDCPEMLERVALLSRHCKLGICGL